MELGVDGLPGEVAGEAFLAAGTDDEIRGGNTGGIEVRNKNFLSDIFGLDPGGDNFFDRPQYFVAAAVVEGKSGGDGSILFCFIDQIEGFFGDIFGKSVDVAEKAKLGPFLDESDGQSGKAHAEDVEDGFDFSLVAFPVFGRKSPEGDVGNLFIGQMLDDRLDGLFDGGFVTFDRIEATASGPAAITVHDDGDVF